MLLIVPELEWTRKSLKQGYSTTQFTASHGHDYCLAAQGQWQVNPNQTNTQFPTGSGLWWEANDRELTKQTKTKESNKRGKNNNKLLCFLKSPFGSLWSNSGDDCSEELGRVGQSAHPYDPMCWDREGGSGNKGQPGLLDTDRLRNSLIIYLCFRFVFGKKYPSNILPLSLVSDTHLKCNSTAWRFTVCPNVVSNLCTCQHRRPCFSIGVLLKHDAKLEIRNREWILLLELDRNILMVL